MTCKTKFNQKVERIQKRLFTKWDKKERRQELNEDSLRQNNFQMFCVCSYTRTNFHWFSIESFITKKILINVKESGGTFIPTIFAELFARAPQYRNFLSKKSFFFCEISLQNAFMVVFENNKKKELRKGKRNSCIFHWNNLFCFIYLFFSFFYGF